MIRYDLESWRPLPPEERDHPSDMSLEIGLGVGLGVGLPLLACFFILFRRRSRRSKNEEAMRLVAQTEGTEQVTYS